MSSGREICWISNAFLLGCRWLCERFKYELAGWLDVHVFRNSVFESVWKLQSLIHTRIPKLTGVHFVLAGQICSSCETNEWVDYKVHERSEAQVGNANTLLHVWV